MRIDQDIQERFDFEKQNLAQRLRGYRESLDGSQARDVLAIYAAVIEPNFIPWVAAASVSARSVQARYAASENLYEEVGENHQGMLHRFVADVNCSPSDRHFTYVAKPVQRMREVVSKMNGLTNTTILAYLENTSEVFIPVLAGIAEDLGANDFEYTDKHGVADIEHSKQFLWALGYERKLHRTPDAVIGEAIMDTQRFIWDIFRIRRD